MRENAINILVDSLLDNYQVKISQYSIKMNGHFSFCVVDGVGEPGTACKQIHCINNFLLCCCVDQFLRKVKYGILALITSDNNFVGLGSRGG